MPVSWLQVALKVLFLPSPAGMAAFEGRVHMLWQTSADSHHICRIYGVSCLGGQAVLVMRLYPHSLAKELVTTSGLSLSSARLGSSQNHRTAESTCHLPGQLRCTVLTT